MTCTPCDLSCLTCSGSADDCIEACEPYQQRDDGECVNNCEDADAFINLTSKQCMTCPDNAEYTSDGCTLDSKEDYCLFNPGNTGDFPWPCACPEGTVPTPAQNKCRDPSDFNIRLELGAKAPQPFRDHEDCDTTISDGDVFLVGKHKYEWSDQVPAL